VQRSSAGSDPTTAAQEILAQRFAGADVVFLSGSVMRGEGTETSDLDLVVVYERLEAAHRESFVHRGWPVEAFVHDPETLRYFFQTDRVGGVPVLLDMVASGVPLPRATALSEAMRSLAEQVLAAGPPRWTDADESRARYTITNLIDDLRSPRSRKELVAAGAALYSDLANYFFRSQGLWSARAKMIPRRLQPQAPAVAERFARAFADLFEHGQAGLVIELTEEILKPRGGWLFAGYKAIAPKEWRSAGEQQAAIDTPNART
jgi:hypothetical protein